METLLLAVAGTVLAAAIIGAWNWLRSSDNRDQLWEAVRQRTCQHEWEPIPEHGPVGGGGSEWCVKCGARR